MFGLYVPRNRLLCLPNEFYHHVLFLDVRNKHIFTSICHFYETSKCIHFTVQNNNINTVLESTQKCVKQRQTTQILCSGCRVWHVYDECMPPVKVDSGLSGGRWAVNYRQVNAAVNGCQSFMKPKLPADRQLPADLELTRLHETGHNSSCSLTHKSQGNYNYAYSDNENNSVENYTYK